MFEIVDNKMGLIVKFLHHKDIISLTKAQINNALECLNDRNHNQTKKKQHNINTFYFLIRYQNQPVTTPPHYNPEIIQNCSTLSFKVPFIRLVNCLPPNLYVTQGQGKAGQGNSASLEIVLFSFVFSQKQTLRLGLKSRTLKSLSTPTSTYRH